MPSELLTSGNNAIMKDIQAERREVADSRCNDCICRTCNKNHVLVNNIFASGGNISCVGCKICIDSKSTAQRPNKKCPFKHLFNTGEESTINK